jgi:hypothetical protein
MDLESRRNTQKENRTQYLMQDILFFEINGLLSSCDETRVKLLVRRDCVHA